MINIENALNIDIVQKCLDLLNSYNVTIIIKCYSLSNMNLLPKYLIIKFVTNVTNVTLFLLGSNFFLKNYLYLLLHKKSHSIEWLRFLNGQYLSKLK